MGATRAILLTTFIHTFLLLQWTAAQLTARITSPGNRLIATLEITNPTSQTISILAWNNAFDNTTNLPVLFAVKDDVGNDVQLASTYAMRAAISIGDFFPMAPGTSYYRTIDLRQIMQNLPSGPSKPSGAGLESKVFTIYPPASFKGFVGDLAAANIVASPSTPVDQAMASLRDVTVLANPQRFSTVFPIIAGGNLDPTFDSQDDGLHVNNDCVAQNLTDSSNALFDAGIYAHSLGMAVNDSTNPLFSLFFPPTSRQVVSAIATAASNSISGMGPHVDLYCSDLRNICANSDILGYSFTPSFIGNSYIVLCPSARALGRAPQPCKTPENGIQYSASTSHVLFHLLMTLNNVVTKVMASPVYGVAACKLLINSTLVDATKNPDSFAQLATAYWAYGFGGLPYNGPSCLPSSGAIPDIQKRAVTAEQWTHHRTAKSANSPRSRSSPGRKVKRHNTLREISEKTQDCSAAELDLINIAITNARALARYASEDLGSVASSDRWTTYFNGDNTIKRQVRNTYNAVANWNTTAPYANDVFYRCDPTRQSFFCRRQSHIQVIPVNEHRIGYAAIMVVCPDFFYFPIALECINPSYTPPYLEDIAADMGGSMLHELLHVKTAAKTQIEILDGNPSCYNWNCMTQHAHDRGLPGFPIWNLPENVASNYEYFAYSARASRKDCSWTGYAGDVYGSIVSMHVQIGAKFIAQYFGG